MMFLIAFGVGLGIAAYRNVEVLPRSVGTVLLVCWAATLLGMYCLGRRSGSAHPVAVANARAEASAQAAAIAGAKQQQMLNVYLDNGAGGRRVAGPGWDEESAGSFVSGDQRSEQVPRLLEARNGLADWP